MLVVDWSEFSKDPRLEYLVLLSLKPSKVNRTQPQSTMVETVLTIEMMSIDWVVRTAIVLAN